MITIKTTRKSKYFLASILLINALYGATDVNSTATQQEPQTPQAQTNANQQATNKVQAPNFNDPNTDYRNSNQQINDNSNTQSTNNENNMNAPTSATMLNYESMKNTGKTSSETRTYEHNTLIDLERQKAQEGKLNYSEVVYEHLKAYQSMPRDAKPSGAVAIKAGYDFYATQNQVKAQQQAIQAQQQQTQQQQAEMPDVRYLQAYCHIPSETTIERLASYAVLSCDFLKYGKGSLSVTLTPDFYSLALIATPLHITLNNEKYLVKEGAVLNANRTSINVATSVNDYKIEKILAAGGMAMGSSVTRAAQEYLDQYEQSQTKQEAGESYISGGVVVTPNTVTNTEKPSAGTYLASAGIEFLGRMAELLGNVYLDSIPYTFKIDQHTMLFADLQVDFNNNGIRGINYAPNNLVQTDEPRIEADGTYSTGNSRSIAKSVPLTDKQTIQTQTQFRPEYNRRGANNTVPMMNNAPANRMNNAQTPIIQQNNAIQNTGAARQIVR